MLGSQDKRLSNTAQLPGAPSCEASALEQTEGCKTKKWRADCQDDDIIPRVGNEMGAGKFPSMVSIFVLAS